MAVRVDIRLHAKARSTVGRREVSCGRREVSWGRMEEEKKWEASKMVTTRLETPATTSAPVLVVG